MSRANLWFVLGDGIAGKVIMVDVKRYIGPEALFMPGIGTGSIGLLDLRKPDLHVGKFDCLTTEYRTKLMYGPKEMIKDLKSATRSWLHELELREDFGGSHSPPLGWPNYANLFEYILTKNRQFSEISYERNERQHDPAAAIHGSANLFFGAAQDPAIPRTLPAIGCNGFKLPGTGYQFPGSLNYASHMQDMPATR